jgi:GNAT superfamily N-acetyltransferase
VAIRPVTPEDAAAVVELTTPIDPTLFATAESFRALLEAGSPEGTERLVAEEDGRIVAWAPSGVHGDLTGWFGISVDPAYRRRGIGGALYERIEARLRDLGAPTLTAQPNDDDGRRFLEQRGYERTNVQRLQTLDIHAADLPEQPESAALRHVDPWSLFELFRRAHADIPSHTPRPEFTKEDFAREVVDSPIVDRDASAVILENGEPVAFALVISNRESGRAGAQMTAVRGDRRGHGLAYAVKVASLRRARELGLQTMLTSNDIENAPMLAVNRKLGFQPTILLESFAKTL